jgi:hypothetical protein
LRADASNDDDAAAAAPAALDSNQLRGRLRLATTTGKMFPKKYQGAQHSVKAQALRGKIL